MNDKVKTFLNISEIEKDFSIASSLADKEGTIIITKHNKPKYILMKYDEDIDKTAEDILNENLEAFLKLSKL